MHSILQSGLYGSYVETNYSDDLPGSGAGIYADNSNLLFEGMV